MGEKRNVFSPIERTRLGHQRGRDRHALRELRDLARRAVVRGVRLRHRDEPFVDVVRDDDRVRARLLRAPRLLDEKTRAAVDADPSCSAEILRLHTDDAARKAADPEEILRARYCAYKARVPEFIMDTTHPSNEEYDADRGAWPLSLAGCYDRDGDHLRDYVSAAKTAEGFAAYLERHVFGAQAAA